jgi:RHS repeat-associated protein
MNTSKTNSSSVSQRTTRGWTWVFRVPPAQVATPVFNPDGGDYAITQPRSVSISTTTTNANMRYTLNGTTPSQTNGNLIASNHGTVSVTPTSDGTTLRAIAFAPGMSDSDVQEATYYYIGGTGANLMTVDSVQSGITPAYDANGNLTTYKGWSYTYDAQNRLTSASNGTISAEFYYDGKNRQIARRIGGVVRFNVWDNWELVEEYATGLQRTEGYLQGATGVIKTLVTNRYYYQDKLGSTTHVANAGGQLLESYKYDLYGTPSYFNSTSQPLNSSTYGVTDLYAGERWIPELRVYDLRNRFMSPELGRFLQPDPTGFKGDASNLYRYCGNDPADRTDPMGLVASDTSRVLPDRLWSMACLFDGGNSFQGSLSEFMQRLNPAGMNPASQFTAISDRIVMGGNALKPIDDPSHYTTEKLKNEYGPAAGLTKQELVPNGDGTVTLKVDWQVRKDLAAKDPNLARTEKQHADRWVAWAGRMNDRNSDVSKAFANGGWDLKTAEAVRAFLDPGQYSMKSYYWNEVKQQKLDLDARGKPHWKLAKSYGDLLD